jgi:hypothetical protein
MECIVCFSDIEGKSYQCSNPKCDDKFCDECLTLLIKYHKEESLLPVCPSRNCRSTLLLCDIRSLPKNIITEYEQCCLNFFLKDQGDNVKKQLLEKNIIDQLRKERQQFITQTYPEAIALVATITFKSKLNQLDKQKKKIVQKQIESSNRKCMNTICGGYLDDNLQCLTCSTNFCKRCEKRLDTNHKCKQEDLDSVNIVNNMIRCPGCNLPVFKNEGCNHITCSNCDTNFEYTTGELSSHGSTNTKLNIDINQVQRLSFSYKDRIPKNILPLLLELESFEPKKLNKDIILLPIKEYYQIIDFQDGKNSQNNGNIRINNISKKLAKQLEKYYLNQYKVQNYMNHMIKIEELLTKEKINQLELNKILSQSIQLMKS